MNYIWNIRGCLLKYGDTATVEEIVRRAFNELPKTEFDELVDQIHSLLVDSPSIVDLAPAVYSILAKFNSEYAEELRSKFDAEIVRREQEAEARRAREGEERLRVEAERQERIRQELLCREKEKQFERLKTAFAEDFLRADSLRKSSCPNVSLEEYEQEKASFIHEWVKDKTGETLDAEQAAAIAAVHGHVQIIARAGSGKTRTLVNRAVFLQRHCRIPPSQILLLAFNQDAVNEMAHRLRKVLGYEIPHVATFHSLAFNIVYPKKEPLFDKEPDLRKSNLVQTFIDAHLHDPRFENRIRALMMAHFREDWAQIIEGHYDKSRDEFLRYRRSLQRESLDGRYLKSFGEKVIADFLFEHEIPYTYEWKERRNHPSFQAEFAIGKPSDPPYPRLFIMSREKRRDWPDAGDRRVLDFTLEQAERAGANGSRDQLKALLEREGITCKRLSEDEIWQRVRKRAVGSCTRAVCDFIGRLQKLSYTPDQLAGEIDRHRPLNNIEQQFLGIALELYRGYCGRAETEKEEDFDELLRRAAQTVTRGETAFKTPRSGRHGDLKELRYLLIDEYQDFSDLFHRLVYAVRLQNPSLQVFCVGDDWQAINGFAGSDLHFYNSFLEYFEGATQLYLPTNYRSYANIVKVGNTLMRGTRGREAVVSKREPGTVLLADLEAFQPNAQEVKRHRRDKLTPAVLRLIKKALSSSDPKKKTSDAKEKKTKVRLLARQNNYLPWYAPGNGLENFFHTVLDCLTQDLGRSPKELESLITISTAHKSKGLEATMVIVLDAVERSYPLIHPNWVFTRILGDTLKKINDEERRLFYVALTRAEESLTILTSGRNPSPFIDEIQEHMTVCNLDWSSFDSPSE